MKLETFTFRGMLALECLCIWVFFSNVFMLETLN